MTISSSFVKGEMVMNLLRSVTQKMFVVFNVVIFIASNFILLADLSFKHIEQREVDEYNVVVANSCVIGL